MHTSEWAASREDVTLATPAERLSAYWATLRRRWPLAVAIVAAAVLAGVVAGLLASKSYEASAKVLVGQRAQVDALLGATDYTPDPEREINTSLELAGLEPVAESVRRRLGLRVGAGALVDKLHAEIDRNSNVVSLTIRDASAERAARMANAFALGFRDFLARASQASIDDAVAAAKARASQLEPGDDRDALEGQVRRLQAASAFKTGGVQIVRRATAASASPTRNLKVNAVIAGFLGMILAAVAIVILSRTDRRVHSEDELEAAVGCAVLATAPASFDSDMDAAGREAFATLALSLTLRRWGSPGPGSPNGRSPQVFLVTSAEPDEGTTAVVLGLAQALGDLGRRALAIEADLRRPGFARALGVDSGWGLGAVLAGARGLDQELVGLPSTSGRDGASVAAVPAGPEVSLPQPLLAGRRMAAVIAEARHTADVVLIAGAPARPFADSLALVPLVDAVLLVARLDMTRRDELQRVVQTFDEVDGRVVGAVATSDERAGRSTFRVGPTRAHAALAWRDPVRRAPPTTNGAATPSPSATEVPR